MHRHGVELVEALFLRQALLDQFGVEALQVRQTHQLRPVGLIADVAFLAVVLIAPLLRGDAEQRDVEHIRLVRVGMARLLRAHFLGDQVGLDRVGMDAIVDLGEVPPHVPVKVLSLVFLKPLELLDEVQLELDGNPRRELQSDIKVGERPAVAPWLGDDTDRAGLLYPLLGCQRETVQPGLLSKPVEFDGFKIRVVQLLPDADKLDRVAVAQPTSDQIIGCASVFVPRNVGEAHIVGLPNPLHGDRRSLNLDDVRHVDTPDGVEFATMKPVEFDPFAYFLPSTHRHLHDVYHAIPERSQSRHPGRPPTPSGFFHQFKEKSAMPRGGEYLVKHTESFCSRSTIR